MNSCGRPNLTATTTQCWLSQEAIHRRSSRVYCFGYARQGR